MSNFNKRITPARGGLIALASASTLAVSLAAAAVTLSADKEVPLVEPKAEAKAETKAESKSSLRCWQYGRLLFEETGVELTPPPNAIALRADQNNILLFEMDETTCMFKAAQK